jgi:fumarate reductase subunit C
MRIGVGSLVLSLFLLAAFTLTSTTKHAHAYIDFGSGSMILQVMLATLFASLFTLKVFWRRMTASLSKIFKKIKNPGDVVK